MASYQNTSEIYCGVSTMLESYADHCIDTNVYSHQNPVNYQMHGVPYTPESYEKQEMYPVQTPQGFVYDPTQRPVIYDNGHYYGNASHPQYNFAQYAQHGPQPVPYPAFYTKAKPHQRNLVKKPHAHITILPSSKGTFKAIVKRKRKRTVFTTEQVEALEKIFKTKQYVTREERQVIVNQLQINDKAVKIWFQNRRLKTKRIQDEEEQENDSGVEHVNEDRTTPDIARLESVESQISKQTDEFGYVTLDDEVMGDLVNVIDDFLTKSNLDVPVEEISGDSSPVYEPISPASGCDSNEDDSSACWTPSEPDEALQRLFDLQTMLSL